MSESRLATLVKLRDNDETVGDRKDDIRGRHVYDANHKPLGKIDALLLDDKEQKIRFIEVASGGFLGLGEQKSLIPIDAITKITEREVHIDQTTETVAGAPVYDPELVNQTHVYESTYGYYGMTPFWNANYMDPAYPGEDPLAGKSMTVAAASSFNDPDIAFATQMIPHHQQAVEMADLVLAKTGVDSRATELATKIKEAQGPEIVTIAKWLRAWGQPAPASMGTVAMNGLTLPADRDALKNASGPASSKLFLQHMIQHHQGAIGVANEELRTGQNTEAVALAKKIVTDQTAEIAAINSLLTAL